MNNNVLLADASLDQINYLLSKHGKRVCGPKEVKAAWLPIILTNSLRATVGEILPFNVHEVAIHELKQINPPHWLVKLRRGKVHEEDIQKLLNIGVTKMEHLKVLASEVMKDAGIGLDARRTIARVTSTSESPSSSINQTTISPCSSPPSSSPSPSARTLTNANTPTALSNRPNNELQNAANRIVVGPVSEDIIDSVIAFMLNQVNNMEMQDEASVANLHRYVRTIVSLLLQILSGRLPFFRLMQSASNIWNLLNRTANSR